MLNRKRTTMAISAVAVAAISAGTVVASTPASAVKPIKVVTIHVNNKRINVTAPVRGGRTVFKVVTSDGNHAVQIVRLHHGYDPQQFGSDIGQAFGGDVDAINRVDENVAFRGGAETAPGHPGYLGVSLDPGDYLLLDLNGQAVAPLHVGSAIGKQNAIPNSGNITTYTYGFGSTPATLPASGWIKFNNVSDQPHFVVFQRVAKDTTAKQVRKYFAGKLGSHPSFLRKGGTDTGVMSPNKFQVVQIDLKPGKYVLACYWPDFKTGMPHAFMGMYRMITLK